MPVKKVIFVPLQEKYIPQMAELEKRCFSVPWTQDMLRKELTNSLAVYYVALLDDTVVGYIGMWQIVGEGHITNVAVAPEYRRKGIANAMLKMLINAVTRQGFLLLTLEVRRSNEAAKQLYRKFGFEVTGERKHYYEDNNEDADIMTLYL